MPLPFDPIDEAARQWALRWDGVPAMHAVTSLMRVQQLVLGRLDAILRPHGLTFARYEALVLLCFSSRGSLPLGKMGERLQVHPTSITSIVQRLEADGLVSRRPHPDDGRAVLAEVTDAGRALVERATADLVGADFALGALSDAAAGRAVRAARAGTPGGRRLRDEPRMTTADAVRRVGLALPRVYERGGARPVEAEGEADRLRRLLSATRRRWASAIPKAERDGLVASDPDTFFLPGTADLRYQWVCAHLDRLGDDEMRELVTDAWRMCTPRMLHDLPELPAPAMRVWDLVERQDWHAVRPLLHPDVRFDDGDGVAPRAAPGAGPPAGPPDPATADRGRASADGQIDRWRTTAPTGWFEATTTGYGLTMRSRSGVLVILSALLVSGVASRPSSAAPERAAPRPAVGPASSCRRRSPAGPGWRPPSSATATSPVASRSTGRGSPRSTLPGETDPLPTQSEVHGLYALAVPDAPPGSPPQPKVERRAALPAWSTLSYNDGSGAYRLSRGTVSHYRQSLHLRTGTLTTSLLWTSPAGKSVHLRYDVTPDRARRHAAAVRLRIVPRFSGTVTITDTLDGTAAEFLRGHGKGHHGRTPVGGRGDAGPARPRHRGVDPGRREGARRGFRRATR